MSKSLKNFTTIREALSRGDWTSRSLRIVFLLGGWKEGIEITDDLVKAGGAWEEKLNNFFIKMNDHTASQDTPSNTDDSLSVALKSAQETVYNSLCDSFNIPGAMQAISELVSKYNKDPKVVNELAKWLTSMVNIFGLNGNAPAESQEIGWSGVQIPEDAKPYLYPLSAIRDSLRQAAKAKTGISKNTINEIVESKALPEKDAPEQAKTYSEVLSNFRTKLSSLDEAGNISKEILSLCDRVRDIDLFDLGIYLEDGDNQPALVRPVTRDLI